MMPLEIACKIFIGELRGMMEVLARLEADGVPRNGLRRRIGARRRALWAMGHPLEEIPDMPETVFSKQRQAAIEAKWADRRAS